MNITKNWIPTVFLLLGFTVVSCNDEVVALDDDSGSVVPKKSHSDSNNDDISENDDELDYEYLSNKMNDLEKRISRTERDRNKYNNRFNEIMDFQKKTNEKGKNKIQFIIDQVPDSKEYGTAIQDLRKHEKFENELAEIIKDKNKFIQYLNRSLREMKEEKNLIKRKQEKFFEIQSKKPSGIIYYYH
ncbi:hypothetical protein [Blattabacterium cuenoti]|uniref:hypothetical protein n=1 Tax=Blattabacterium cuenoti TaxID=1653831 RepID=UPI00163BDB75|nr:hypothetical protein [Blattabacterium cuenoti]